MFCVKDPSCHTRRKNTVFVTVKPFGGISSAESIPRLGYEFNLLTVNTDSRASTTGSIAQMFRVTQQGFRDGF